MINGSVDEVFLKTFEDCTLPSAEWKHRAHLKVAYLYLCALPFPEALNRSRRNIQRYNAATHTPENLERGYHETLTVAWLRLVQCALEASGPAASADEFLERESHLLNSRALRFFYSHDRLISWQAKGEFVEPDLASLPRRAEALAG